MGVGFCADLSWLIQSSCGNNVAYVCEQVHKSLSGLESILVHVSRHIINTPLSDVHSESPSVLFQRLFSAAHSYRRLSKAAVHAQLSLWLVAYTRPWILGQWNVPNTSRYTSRALRSRAQSQSIEGPKLWPNTFSALFFLFLIDQHLSCQRCTYLRSLTEIVVTSQRYTDFLLDFLCIEMKFR